MKTEDNGHMNTTRLADGDTTLDETLIIVNEPEGPATGKKEKKSRGKKLGLAVLGLVLLTGIVAALLMTGFFSDKKVVKTVEPPPRAELNTAEPDAAQKIEALGQAMRAGDPVVQASPGDPLARTGGIAYDPPGVGTLPQSPVTGATPGVTDVPVTSTYPGMEAATAGAAGTVASAPAATSATGQSGPRAAPSRVVQLSEIESSPSKQTSTYFFTTPFVKAAAADQTPAADAGSVEADAPPARPAPVVPPFGATLPVRNLGAVYSLRTDAYVRLETTRAVKGDGWALPRGTQLIGSVTGAQDNRVFIKLVGFLSDGKLVRAGGEVSGVDGGPGLKGERKNIGKRWLKALREVGSSGVSVLNSWLSGRGGGTQIYMPSASGSLRELQGQYGLQNSREYVAVKAGTLGTVMITDLPEAVRGVAPDVTGGESAQPGSPMGEAEIVELLTTGTPEQIRAALPRMPREVRALAEAALKEN